MSIEFVRVVLGLRDEYLRNSKRLARLKELVDVDSQRFSDYTLYMTKVNEEITLFLSQVLKSENLRTRIKHAIGRNGVVRNDVIGANGHYYFTNSDGVEIKDNVEFSQLVEDLKNDSFLKSDFSSLGRIDKHTVVRVGFDNVSYDVYDNQDPKGVKYIGASDVLHLVYYEPLYDVLREMYAWDLLNAKIPKDKIPYDKLQIINNSGILDKNIELSKDIKFKTTFDERAILNLQPEINDDNVTLKMIK